MNATDESPIGESIEERRLAVGVAELSERCVPPDLTDVILARLNQDERGDECTRVHERGRRWWLAVAVVLFAVGVTYAVLSRDEDEPAPPEVPVQERVIPPHHDVTSRAAIDALPKDVVHVRGHNLSDTDVPALLRLSGLRFLDLSRCRVTDACLGYLANLTKLERLVLNGLPLRGRGFARLSVLPNLVHLELSRTRVNGLGLVEIAMLESLRHLDISHCGGFGDRGMDSVLRMRGLQHLSLSGNDLIGERALMRLGGLDQLRHLELADIDGASERMVVGLRIETRTGDETGVCDLVLGVLASKLPKLRYLDVSGCEHVTDVGIGRLAALDHLHSLDLSRCPRVTSGMLTELVRSKKWRLLGMPVTEPRAIEALVATNAPLRELRLSGAASTRPHLASVPRLGNLEVLELCGMTLRAEDLLPLEDAPALRFIRVSHCALTARHQLQGLVGKATFLSVEGGPEIIQFNKHRGRSR